MEKYDFSVLFDKGRGFKNNSRKIEDKPKQKENEMESIYVLKGTTDFGKVIATDSKGNKIFELKTGGIKVVAASEVEEVFPFTFAVTFDGKKEYHFQGDSEKVSKGDVMLYLGGEFGYGICVVSKVDTKSRAATKTFNGYKIQAEKVN